MDWNAFAGGFSGTVLNSWENRDKDERTFRLQQKLEQLRRETSDYEFNRNLAQERRQVKAQKFDPNTGETIDLNMEGTEVGRNKDPAALEEYRRGQQKFDLDVANVKSQISARNEGLSLERARLDESRKDRESRERIATMGMPGTGAGGTGGMSSSTAFGRALFDNNKSVVDAAVKDGIPAETIARLATEAAARAGRNQTGLDGAQKIFLDGITVLRQGLTENSWDPSAYNKSRGR